MNLEIYLADASIIRSVGWRTDIGREERGGEAGERA